MQASSSPRILGQPDPSRHYQRGTALNRVLTEAPYLARCSDDKTAARVRPREYAISYPYMQVNRPGMAAWLIFDLDHANAWIWEEAGLPAPNLIVRNRTTGAGHLFYAITPVCTTESGRGKPQQYMKAVYEAFVGKLRADPQYHSGPVAKTPGHPWWQTTELHAKVYELGELAEYVDLARRSPWSKGPRLEQAAHSRHCTLFELVRHYAYGIVGGEREKGSFEAFSRRVEAFAHNSNQFAGRGFAEHLPLSSIKATVKSICRWTWDRYTGAGGCHRGAMRLDKSLSVRERQRLAAQRTHELRARATASKVRACARALLASGKAITQCAVAKAAKLARQTVAKYQEVIDEVLTAAAKPVVEAISRSSAVVKHAVHQVPGGLVDSPPAKEREPAPPENADGPEERGSG